MIFQSNIFITTCLLSMKFSADAFSFVPSLRAPSSTLMQQQHLSETFNSRYSTSLFAEEESKGEAAEEEVETKGEEKSSDSGNDILNSPAFLKRKLEVLKSDIETIDGKISDFNTIYEQNKAEWGPQLDELRKEYANIQDRMKQKMKNGQGLANIEIARKILDVIDNFDRAFASVVADSDEDKEVEASYKEAYDMILKEFADIGVKPVEAVGIEFDYEFHQAVMTRPDEDYEEGIVCEELAKGFAMEDGTLIRAAMVVVAA